MCAKAKDIIRLCRLSWLVLRSTAEEHGRGYNQADAQRLDAFWDNYHCCLLIELHKDIAQRAVELLRHAKTQGTKLKNHDAIHLATAWWLSEHPGIDAFHTYDKDFSKVSDLVSFTICQPSHPQPRLLP